MYKSCIIFLFALAACHKTTTEPDTIEVELTIVQNKTQASQSQEEGIVSRIVSTGGSSCYRFDHFEVLKTGERQFEIHSKGKIPNKKDLVCLDIVYYKDTTLKINTPAKGSNLLYFYNQNSLFDVDTVQVY